MKVVLDTNVILAAFATRGLCAAVFQLCLTKYKILLSEYILSEVAEGLANKIRLPHVTVQEITQFLREHAQMVKPEAIEESISEDEQDLPIIGTALTGNAHFLITGDKDLLSLHKYKHVQILSPREFWERVKEGRYGKGGIR